LWWWKRETALVGGHAARAAGSKGPVVIVFAIVVARCGRDLSDRWTPYVETRVRCLIMFGDREHRRRRGCECFSDAWM
jgi:hypothetical protein